VRRRPILAFIVLGAVVAVAVSANALSNRTPRLAATTPESLIASTTKALSDSPSVSGSVAWHVDLGLPSIGGFRNATNPADIVGGDHEVRVWMSHDGLRIDDLLSMSQRSLFVSPTDAWAWDSETYAAYHLGPFEKTATPREPVSPLPVPDPLEMAGRALAAVDPTTTVDLAKPVSVAGRAAYVLRLRPQTPKTLVGSIDIAIDAARSIPLRVSLFARDASTAAVAVGFTSVRLGAIDPSVYRFTPPRGATVKQTRIRFPHEPAMSPTGVRRPAGSPNESFRTFGSDWATVMAFRMASPARGTKGSFDLRELLPYTGPLFSARLVDRGDHGWIVGGLVPQSELILISSQLP